MADNGKKWQDLSRKYRNYIKFEKRLSDNTVESYMRDLQQFAHFILRTFDASPTKVEPPMVERYLAWCFDCGKVQTSQARVLSSIKSFYNFLLLSELMDSAPTEFIDAPKCARHLPDTLSVEEIDHIITSIDPSTKKGLRDRAIIELLYSCGLRVTELTQLKVGDLFFGEGYIRVVGKGDKQRIVPVGDVARERIYLYLDARRVDGDNSDVLFLNNRGGALTRVMIFTIIREAVARAQIDKRVSPHTFRHSFATHLLQGGATIRQVQDMLGHESITTTEIYTHLDVDNLAEVLERNMKI